MIKLTDIMVVLVIMEAIHIIPEIMKVVHIVPAIMEDNVMMDIHQ